MKKTVRVLALVMALTMVLFVFASCGKKLSGKYAAEVLGTGATYEFKGSKVTITVKALGATAATLEGTYKIEDDKITSADLICTYSMTVNGQEIKFSMNSDMTYKYNDNISVTAPSDASAYETVDYDELRPA